MSIVESKNILITGGAGFIGHHLINYLLEHTNHRITTIDRIDTSSSLSRLQDVLKNNGEWKQRVNIVWHDLKSPVNNYIADQLGDVDIVLHLAAGSHVNRSIVDPLGFTLDNVVGTVNMLEYARHKLPNLELFLNFSTDEVFGPAVEGVTFSEDDRHNPCNPYSASKSGAEHMCNAYYHSYGIPLITTHTMNVYGIRQHKEKFIPLLINKIKDDQLVSIHTDEAGENSGLRKYLHADDVSSAILFLIEKGVIGEKYNISSVEEVSNMELATKVARALGKSLNYECVYPKETRGKNDFRYSISGEKLKKLGWQQKVFIDDALREMIGWYQDNPEWLF